MDKFGIFNLINSFLTEYKNKTFINNSNNSNTATTQKTPSVSPSVAEKTYLPLKDELYKTMASHENFVKRVIKNNKPVSKN